MYKVLPCSALAWAKIIDVQPRDTTRHGGARPVLLFGSPTFIHGQLAYGWTIIWLPINQSSSSSNDIPFILDRWICARQGKRGSRRTRHMHVTFDSLRWRISYPHKNKRLLVFVNYPIHTPSHRLRPKLTLDPTTLLLTTTVARMANDNNVTLQNELPHLYEIHTDHNLNRLQKKRNTETLGIAYKSWVFFRMKTS